MFFSLLWYCFVCRIGWMVARHSRRLTKWSLLLLLLRFVTRRATFCVFGLVAAVPAADGVYLHLLLIRMVNLIDYCVTVMAKSKACKKKPWYMRTNNKRINQHPFHATRKSNSHTPDTLISLHQQTIRTVCFARYTKPPWLTFRRWDSPVMSNFHRAPTATTTIHTHISIRHR